MTKKSKGKVPPRKPPQTPGNPVKPDPVPPRPKGRPRVELTEKDLEMIEKMAGRLPVEEMAYFLGVCKKTIERLAKTDEAVKDALEKGRAVNRGSLKLRAWDQAMKGDKTMLIFLLKTQCGYRETHRLEHDVPKDSDLGKYMAMGREKLIELIKENNKKLGIK